MGFHKLSRSRPSSYSPACDPYLVRAWPYLGYLGGLLSWSWGTIRTYDEGYGIILTATCLLPMALIPSIWVPPDWPGSPSSGTSVNLSSP
ncbi:hypothetical protein M378DRAFT_866535 [Amanita muscaria Koide BX008]|uniref:Uncharacterized protein n=1 Tax=Amanita muscaria (strain Koide BX008) TaxID=946122 RepID=A0A0C2WXL4_AMAMK|nr:hypothetical protein M378DRAFT_866535 [Amanita muscaria Koide BX008]